MESRFEGKYKLDKKIGEGMHSQVYLCYRNDDTDRAKPLAVKISREDDEEKKLAHHKEFKITNSLDHKNIIKSLEMFDNPLTGEIHQIMDYVEGTEVLEAIANQVDGYYTEDCAKFLFKQYMEGIDYLHSQGVVHRDIKPQNILVSFDNKVFIMDFNVSF